MKEILRQLLGEKDERKPADESLFLSGRNYLNPQMPAPEPEKTALPPVPVQVGPVAGLVTINDNGQIIKLAPGEVYEGGIRIIPGPAPTFTGLLDDYPGAAAAFSLRRLSVNYTGPLVQVRRASDNDETTIPYKDDGTLDVGVLNAFAAGTDAFVSEWPDQSGNGNDATQTSSSLQDKIYDSSTGVLLTNSKPSTTPQGFGGYVITGLTGNATTSVFEVIYANQSPTISLDSANTVGKYPYLAWNGQTGIVGRGTNFYLNGSAQSWVTRDNAWQAINNQQVLLDYQLDTSDYSDFELRYGLNNTAYAPIRQETIIYFSDQSANRTGIESNINDFYSIY